MVGGSAEMLIPIALPPAVGSNLVKIRINQVPHTVERTFRESNEIIGGQLAKRDVPSEGHPAHLFLQCCLHGHVTYQ